MVQVLDPGQVVEELRDVHPPAGRGTGKIAEHRGSTLAPPPEDRVANVEPVVLADRVGQQAGAEEGSDIGDGPVVAGLDEEVVPEIVHVEPEARDLGRDRPDDGPQGLARVEIAGAVDLRQPLVEPLRPGRRVVGDQSEKPPSGGSNSTFAWARPVAGTGMLLASVPLAVVPGLRARITASATPSTAARAA